MNAHQDPKGVIPERPESQSAPPARASWRSGADTLRRHHLGEVAAMCLEAAAPLAVVASQLLYAGIPFLGSRAMQLARFLESETAIPVLAHYLATGVDNAAVSPGVVHE